MKKKSRISKIIALTLIICLVFSFNMAFADDSCTPYSGTIEKANVSDGNDPSPAAGKGGRFNSSGTETQTASGPPATSVTAVIDGQTAHITVNQGAVGKLVIKGALQYREWTFDPSIQAGECVNVSSEGLTTPNGKNQPDISHITWYVGTVTEEEEETGSITINKTFKDTEDAAAAPQEGVEFTLRGEGLASDLNGETDEDGVLTFDELKPGTYTLTETLPDDDYTSSLGEGGTGEITVKSGEVTIVDVLNTKYIPEPPVPGSIQINKTYKDTEDATAAPQEDVEFTLSGEGLESDLTGTTDEDGILIFDELEPGTYTLTETVPDGYTSSLGEGGTDEITVVSGEVTTVDVLNTKTPTTGSIVITKSYVLLDEEEEMPELYSVMQAPTLPTATFRLWVYENDTMVAYEPQPTVTIDGEDSGTFSNLPFGTYYLTEDEINNENFGEFTPSFMGLLQHDGFPGYYMVSISAENPNRNVAVVNTEEGAVFGTVEILKTYSNGRNPAGTEFVLYTGVEGDYTEVGRSKADADGKLFFSGLDLSKDYYLSEVIPSGYRSSLAAYTLVKFNDDNIASIEVTNTRRSTGGGGDPEPITPTPEEPVTTPPEEPVVVPEEPEVFAPPTQELPKTGGNTAAYLFSGSALAGLGVLLRRFKR